MSNFNQKLYVKSAKGRIIKKISDIENESRCVVTYLNEIVLQFQEKAKVLSVANDEEFYNIYQKIKKDLDTYEEKLCFIQDYLNGGETEDPESFLDCKAEVNATGTLNQHHLNSKTSVHIKESNITPHIKESNIAEPKSSNEDSNISENIKDCIDVSKKVDIISVSKDVNEIIEASKNVDIIIQESKNVNESNESSDESVSLKYSISNTDLAPKSPIETNHDSKKSCNENVHELSSSDVNAKSNKSKNKSPVVKNTPNISERDFKKQSSVASQHSGSHSSSYQSLSSVCAETLQDKDSISEKNFHSITKPTGLQENSNAYEYFSWSSESSSYKSINDTDVKRIDRVLSPCKITVQSSISAVITHVVDPGNFWMQVQDPRFTKFCTYALSDKIPSTTFVQGDFCLAPFKREVLYRAVIQSIINEVVGACAFQEEEIAKVFFVDHGYTEEIPMKMLKHLPDRAYDVPMLAFHCYMTEIYPIGESWSPAATKKFKKLVHDYNTQTVVICKKDNMYGVSLPVILPLLDLDDLSSMDIASMLHLSGLALDSKKHHIKDYNLTLSDNSDVSSEPDQNYDKKELCGLDTVLSSVENRISCDSGVSVTSFHGASSPQKGNISSDSINDFIPGATAMTQDSLDGCGLDKNISSGDETFKRTLIKTTQNDFTNHAGHVESSSKNFDSYSKFTDDANCIANELKHMDIVPLNNLTVMEQKVNSRNLTWHIVIDEPVITFMEKDMMLVMMSHIQNPGDFYVHLAQENSNCLDDLQEQLSDIYETIENPSDMKLMTEFLRESMYCAAPYEQDGNWYRARILSINKSAGLVEVQFIDYGNIEIVHIHNLRPLLPVLAKYSAFAIRCSLALVKPNSDNNPHKKWSEHSINTFKKLTGYEKCLTAQILKDIPNNSGVLPILLWEDHGSEDLCINEALVAEKAAEFIPNIQDNSNTENHENSVLNDWNPMADHYNGLENSYGVDETNLEVSTVGYKANDEKYTCKFFNRNQQCPRGDTCPFQHIITDVDGVTRDQDATFSFDCVPPLPKDKTYVLLEISAVVNPGHFYAVFPFGPKSVDEIDENIRSGSSMKDIVIVEPKLLTSSMSKHYNKAPFRENTAIALASGNIVVAKSSCDNLWHRARVITIQEITSPVEVFFVDRGYREVIPRKYVREILPEYTHMPFQAVECFLSDIEPKNFEKGCFWTNNSRDVFQKLVENKILLSYIAHKDVSKLYLTLKNTTQSDHQSISEVLVADGHAQYVTHQKNQYSQKSNNLMYLPG